MSNTNIDPTIDPNNTNPNPAPPADPIDPPIDTVDRKAFDSVKNDMHRYKDETARLKKELDDAKLAKLKDAQNWEEIAKLKEKEANENKAAFEGLKSSLVDSHRFAALEKEALKAGIHPQSLGDLQMLDFNELTIETTSTGKIIVNGADKAISALKLKRPHWFGANPVTINSSSPEVLSPTGAVSIADLEKAEIDYRKNPHDQVMRNRYFDMIQKFKSQ
jgi:hypothetical protein